MPIAMASRKASPAKSVSGRPRTRLLPEVREPLLAGRPALPRGEFVLNHPRQATELVHAPGPEPCVVVVEEHERALDRVGGLVELAVPLPHLRGLVPLLLLELRQVAVPDHPEVYVVRGH